MPWPLIIGAAFGGIGNAISNSSSTNKNNSNIDNYIRMLGDAQISDEEIDGLLKNIKRRFNSKVSTTLNSAAFQSRGTANSNVAASAMIAPLVAQEYETNVDVKERQLSHNKGIEAEKAKGQLGYQDSNFLGSFISGAVSGGMAGHQIGTNMSLTSTLEDIKSRLNPLASPDTSNLSGNYSNGFTRFTNPFLTQNTSSSFLDTYSPGKTKFGLYGYK
jgi:hypothetical protein